MEAGKFIALFVALTINANALNLDSIMKGAKMADTAAKKHQQEKLKEYIQLDTSNMSLLDIKQSIKKYCDNGLAEACGDYGGYLMLGSDFDLDKAIKLQSLCVSQTKNSFFKSIISIDLDIAKTMKLNGITDGDSATRYILKSIHTFYDGCRNGSDYDCLRTYSTNNTLIMTGVISKSEWQENYKRILQSWDAILGQKPYYHQMKSYEKQSSGQ